MKNGALTLSFLFIVVFWRNVLRQKAIHSTASVLGSSEVERIPILRVWGKLVLNLNLD